MAKCDVCGKTFEKKERVFELDGQKLCKPDWAKAREPKGL